MANTYQAQMEFAPPAASGLVGSLAAAVATHLLLVLVLAAGVQWKHANPPVIVQAEIWSLLPQAAAPPALPPEPAPEPAPAPPEPPKPPPEPERARETVPDPQIAIAREKERQQKLQEQEREREKKKAEKERQAKLDKDKREKEKLAAEKKEKEEKLARDKAAAERKNAAQAQAKLSAAEERRLEELRKQNLARMAGLAAGTGDPGSTGTAAQASGPSAGYGGRIIARIKPNIVYTEAVVGNPRVEVEIRTGPTGTILSARITQPSGVKSWDDAVLRAIEKTQVLPADTDGRVPTALHIGFRPKD